MSGETTATNATQRGKTIKMVHNYSWFYLLRLVLSCVGLIKSKITVQKKEIKSYSSYYNKILVSKKSQKYSITTNKLLNRNRSKTTAKASRHHND